MILERTSSEILVHLPVDIDLTELQNLLDYLRYQELTTKSKAKQADADKLAKSAKKAIWKKIKIHRGL